MILKPMNLVQAAAADISRRSRNIARHEGTLHDAMEPYAFTAAHVRRARDELHLLQLAKRQAMRRAPKTEKKNTRLIYSDVDLLKKAIAILDG